MKTSIIMAAVAAVGLSVSGARAQWAATFSNDISNPVNYLSGEVDLRFVYSGPVITYDLGTVTFVGNEAFTYSNAAVDGSNLIGYYIFGPGNETRKNAFVSTVVGGTVTLGRGRTGAGVTSFSGTASNYGPTVAVPSLSFSAGSTIISTGTYDARQLTLGATISGAGLPAGAYITGILGSGAFTISAPTTSAGSGVAATQSGASTYGRALSLTVGSNIQTTHDFVYLNTFKSDATTLGGTGTLFFNNNKTLFSVAQGPTSDSNFNVDVAVKVAGDLTVNVGVGYAPAYYGEGASSNSQLVPSTPYVNFNRVVTVEGDITKVGTERMKLKDQGALVLNGGEFNLTDSVVMLERGNQTLAVGAERIRGASAINIALNPYSFRGSQLVLNGDSNSGALATGIGGLVAKDIAINLLGGTVLAQGARLVGQEDWLESVGAVNLLSGRNYLGFSGTGNNGRGWGLQVAELNRQNGATLTLVGLPNTYSGSVQLKIASDSTFANTQLVGTVSGTGVTNLKILPWATGQNAIMGSGGLNTNGVEMITYVTGSGFRTLAASEYAAVIDYAKNDENVKLADAQTLTASATVNAIRSPNKALTMAGGERLAITSGLLISEGGFDIKTGASAAQIYTGSRALTIMGSGGVNFTGANNVYVNDIAKGSKEAGLIVATGGNVSLFTGSFGGTVLIENGNFVAGGAGSLGTHNDVRVDTRASFIVQAQVVAGSLAGSGVITFQNDQRRLGLGGAVGANNNEIVVRAGASVTPGDVAGPLQTGALYFSDYIDSIVFDSGATLNLNLAGDGLSSSLANINTKTSNPHTLTFNAGAIITLNFLDGYTPADGDTWLFTSGFTGINGDLDNVLLQDSLGNSLSDLYKLNLSGGSLQLSAIPEPSAWLLLSLGGALLLTLRRRR